MESPTAAPPEGPPRAASPTPGGAGAGDCNSFAAFLALLIALQLVLVLATVLVYDVVCLVRRYHRRRTGSGSGERDDISDPENPPSTPPPSQSLLLIYSAATTNLAGNTADCAICLAEFADGDAIRVMPACRHGFHASCMERWLAGARCSSCPTCRAPAVQPDEATDSGAGDYKGDVASIFLDALVTAIALALLRATIHHFHQVQGKPILGRCPWT